MIKYDAHKIGAFKVGAVVATTRNYHYKLEAGEHDYGVGHVEKLVLNPETQEVYIAVNFVNPKTKGYLDVMHPSDLVAFKDNHFS